MAAPTWDEYLSETAEFLTLARRALDVGSAVPDPPTHPVGAVPDDRLDECRRLVLGIEQLSSEVGGRMAQIEKRLAAMPRIAHQGRNLPYFIDTPL
ncbi:MAG TPA: hypothetical protein VGZ04_10815 [Acidimicrobiales bacterium]|jgi:hypothetical protein|nr:hypothetical protein [Acidimicrobiales bacterium]